jgi:hypothetical protein
MNGPQAEWYAFIGILAIIGAAILLIWWVS